MLEWIISSSVLILLVLAVRALGKNRLSCRVRYALWLLVLVRLLVPVQLIETPWSISLFTPGTLMEKQFGRETVSTLELDTWGYDENGNPLFKSSEDQKAWEDFSHSLPPGTTADSSAMTSSILQDSASATWYAYHWSAADILRAVWLAGAGGMAAVLLVSNLCFIWRLKRSRVPYDALCGGMRVYVAEELASPCLVGVFRPGVYLTPESTRDELTLRHVLAHETTHRLHGDCVWSVLRLIALCLHWYNPLVWYAVIVSKRDGELACDEATLQRLGEEERIPYGETLLRMVTAKPGGRDLLSVSTAMTAGKKTLRERIETIARHPKTRWAALLLACAVLLSATVLAFSKAREEHLTAETAMDALESSVHWDDEGNVSFTIPRGYVTSADWQIQIAGRSVAEDGMSKSVHEYELFPGVTVWKAGKEYAIRTGDLTDLFLTASLPDANGGRVTTEIDLLTGNSERDGVEKLRVTDSYMVEVRRADGGAWSICIPTEGWTRDGDTWISDAGSVLAVTWLEDKLDSELAASYRNIGYADEGLRELHSENPNTHRYRSAHFFPAADGGYWQVLTQHDTDLSSPGYQGMEPELLEAMAESFRTAEPAVEGKATLPDFDAFAGRVRDVADAESGRGGDKAFFDEIAETEVRDGTLQYWTLTYLSDTEQIETDEIYSTGSPDDMWDVIALRRPDGSYSILKATRFDGTLTGNREDMEKALRSWYAAQFGESALETSPSSSDPSYRWDADLDGDGVPEQIWLDPGEFDAGGEASMWIETGTGEHVELARIATAHTGWSTVALTERGGKTFLLTYHPTMFQGYANYNYQLMELREGKLAVVDSAEVSFSVNPGQEENNNIEALRAFQEKANGVWSQSGVLFTTDQNVLPHLSYADSGDAVLTNPRYYIWDAQEAAHGKVRYEETMYGLLDADEPIDAPALTPDEPLPNG